MSRQFVFFGSYTTHNLIRNVIVMGLPYAANAFIMRFKLAKIIAFAMHTKHTHNTPYPNGSPLTLGARMQASNNGRTIYSGQTLTFGLSQHFKSHSTYSLTHWWWEAIPSLSVSLSLFRSFFLSSHSYWPEA